MITLPELKVELDTDPNSYGYAALIAAGSTNLLVDVLNEVRPSIQILRPTVPANEIIQAIVYADYAIVPANQQSKRDWISMILALGEVPTSSQNIVDGFSDIFAGKPSLANLNAIRNRSGSRIEQLFAPNDVVTRQNVLDALAL